MPDTFTSNLNLTKPEVGASRDTWGVKWNSNADSLDTAIANRALRATEIGTAGGLEGGGSLAANRVLSISDGGVSTAKIANGAVTNAKLAGGNVPALLGYTPLNKAGDTMTGNLDVPSMSVTGATPTIWFYDNDQADFAVQVNSNVWHIFNQSGTAIIYTDQSGNLTAAGNVSAYSDASLKENVVTMHDGLELVRKMRGVRYTRIVDGRAEVGVIAQEIEPVLPEVVHHGEKLSVAYQNLTAPLIEAVKQLDEIVAKQGRAIEDLTSRIKALEAK